MQKKVTNKMSKKKKKEVRKKEGRKMENETRSGKRLHLLHGNWTSSVNPCGRSTAILRVHSEVSHLHLILTSSP